VSLAGIEALPAGPAYHLVLVPLRDPKIFRLRDLWIATQNDVTEQLAVQGLFSGKPYDGVRWTVRYVEVDERWYIGQIRTTDTLHFGLGRTVDGLEYDFVDYAFPATIPTADFARLL
ncbi:MAG: hypothetical protein ACREM2_10810, partial [Vulcanimicrobiaceae bacterium]